MKDLERAASTKKMNKRLIIKQVIKRFVLKKGKNTEGYPLSILTLLP
jgi:hypothetical protein